MESLAQGEHRIIDTAMILDVTNANTFEL
jgi:hypothetical protein